MFSTKIGANETTNTVLAHTHLLRAQGISKSLTLRKQNNRRLRVMLTYT